MTGHRDDHEERDESGTDERELRPPSTAERITLAAGVALILGLIAIVTYFTLVAGGGPPQIEATPLIADDRGEDGPYYLPVAIANRGGQTAKDVLVLITLETGDEAPETAELTVDFLAGGETVERTAVFSADPADGELSIDIASFH